MESYVYVKYFLMTQHSIKYIFFALLTGKKKQTLKNHDHRFPSNDLI